MATPMGLEPTTSAVTGRRSNQLNYRTVLELMMRLELTTSAVTGRRSNQLNYQAKRLVGTIGLEPMTLCL